MQTHTLAQMAILTLQASEVLEKVCIKQWRKKNSSLNLSCPENSGPPLVCEHCSVQRRMWDTLELWGSFLLKFSKHIFFCLLCDLNILPEWKNQQNIRQVLLEVRKAIQVKRLISEGAYYWNILQLIGNNDKWPINLICVNNYKGLHYSNFFLSLCSKLHHCSQ